MRPGEPPLPGDRQRAQDSGRVPLGRDDVPWLAALLLLGTLLLAAFFLNAYRETNGQGGVPLDDPWIHFQFARNLARGDGFAYNPGQPTAGSTAPLWTVLLAAIYAVGGRFPLAGQILGAGCYLVTLVATYSLARRLTERRWLAWLAATVAAVNGRLVWAGLSGLETCLFAALSLLAIGSHLRQESTNRYRLRTAALFGLAALARPEGLLLFALSLADFALEALWRGQGGKAVEADVGSTLASILRGVLPAVATFAVLFLPYSIFSLRTAGHLLPNTFSAKTTFNFQPDLDFLSRASRYLILDNPVLLPFVVLGMGTALLRARLLGAWSIGLPVAYAFLHASLYQHGRYLIPLIPCNAVFAVTGLLEAGRLARRRNRRWRGSQVSLVLLVTALAVAGTAWRLPSMARFYAHNVQEINHMHVALGEWVEEHTPEDALIALNDIGAITYVSERRIVDLVGLVTPEVIPLLRSPDRASKLINLMADRGVDYVIIFPNWFPDLAARDDVLEPVHQVTLERRTITGGDTMVVYRPSWPAGGR